MFGNPSLGMAQKLYFPFLGRRPPPPQSLQLGGFISGHTPSGMHVALLQNDPFSFDISVACSIQTLSDCWEFVWGMRVIL